MWADFPGVMITDRRLECCLTLTAHTEPPAALLIRGRKDLRRQPRKGMGKKGGMKRTLHRHAGWHCTIPKFCRYTTGIFPPTCVTSKHTAGKWAGCVASAQNASEHVKCSREEYLRQESPRDLRKCWDRCHWRSDLLCHSFQINIKKQWVPLSTPDLPHLEHRGDNNVNYYITPFFLFSFRF